MLNTKALLAVADEIGTSFTSLFKRAVVNDTEESRIAACLCLSIAEGFGAALAVLHSPFGSHAPVLVRSMHEALADLRNLIADRTYLDQIRFDNADQHLKTFDGFLADADLADDAEMQKSMREWHATERAIFDDLRAKGFKTQSISQRFAKAGMTGEYATAYRVACGFTHTNLNMLVARHGGVGPIRFAEPLPPETLKMVVGMALADFARAVETIPSYTNVTNEQVQMVMDEVNANWEKLQ